MEISGSHALSSVLSQIAAHNAVSNVQQTAAPVRSSPVQTVMRAAPAAEPDANEALTYTMEQLRNARRTAMQGGGAIKGSIISVYA
ncbi:hypothetical protein [Endothiovibrio diazotrophicus]